ncbi:MAG TPA: hypothetical protein VJ992_02085, partial [Gemmatimonadales bacterium]|nr:hypothetical protein [Gemmatimonadales bacterium]
MSAFHRALAALALVPTVALAQGRPVAEIGTRMGATIEAAGGQTTTYFGVPGAGVMAQPSLYASFFTASNMMVEPEISFLHATSGGSTYTSFGTFLSGGPRFPNPDGSGLYTLGSVGLQAISGGGSSHTEAAIGARAGYRFVVERSLGLRLDLGYRRWLGSSHLN